MCSSFSKCTECEIGGFACSIGLLNKSIEDDEKIIKIVEKWAAEHPLRTRQSEFLKMFPNAELGEDGVLVIQPCDLDSSYCYLDSSYRHSNYGVEESKANSCRGKTCEDCRREYWLTALEDED